MDPLITPKVPKSLANNYLGEYPKCSHREITAECEFQIRPKCRKKWVAEYREICRTADRNNGKVICLYCSRTLKYSGRNNPNCQYKNIKDDIFKNIDSEDQAYL